MKKLSLLLSSLLLILAFTVSGTVSAKVVSGHQGLGSGLHPAETAVEALVRLDSALFSDEDASGPPPCYKE